MVTTLEDRLIAALTARADQVRAEDLTPRSSPTSTGRARRLLPWVATGATVAAAAALVAVVVPGHRHHDDSADRIPPGAAAATGDVDGDGTDDQVWQSPTGPVQVELSSGRHLQVPGETLEGLADIGTKAYALVTKVGTGHAQELRVRTYDDGRPHRIPVADHGHLYDDGRVSVSWIDSKHRLISGDVYGEGRYRRIEPAFRYRVEAGSLDGSPIAEVCWDTTTSATPEGCPKGITGIPRVGSHDGLPALFPAGDRGAVDVSRTVDVRKQAERPLYLTLVESSGASGVDLVRHPTPDVRSSSADRVHIPLPHGGSPLLDTDLTRSGGLGVVVVLDSSGGDGRDAWVALEGDRPRLVTMPETDVPFGNGTTDGRAFETWVAQDGQLYTRLETGTAGHFQVWRWTRDGAAATVAKVGDDVCIDDQNRDQIRYGTC